MHKGEERDWNIEVIRTEGTVKISVQGHIEKLPLLGVPSEMFLPHDSEGLLIEASAEGPVAPVWREGGYDEWVERFR